MNDDGFGMTSHTDELADLHREVERLQKLVDAGGVLLADAVLREREACARIAYRAASDSAGGMAAGEGWCGIAASAAADAIRARRP